MMVKLARAGLLGLLVKVHLPMREPRLVVKATGKSFNEAKILSSILELVHSSNVCNNTIWCLLVYQIY